MVLTLTGRSPASDYLDLLISQEIASIMVDDFDNNIIDIITLQEWVSLFEYFKGGVDTKITFKADTLVIIMQSDKHVTPCKRRSIDPRMSLE